MWELPQAKSPSGIVHSFWTVNKAYEQVASVDIGHIVAQELLSTSVDNIYDGVKIIELEGPKKYAPLDYAPLLSKLLGKQVTYVDNPYEAWEGIFRGMGMKNPQLRIAMMHNFNQVYLYIVDILIEIENIYMCMHASYVYHSVSCILIL